MAASTDHTARDHIYRVQSEGEHYRSIPSRWEIRESGNLSSPPVQSLGITGTSVQGYHGTKAALHPDSSIPMLATQALVSFGGDFLTRPTLLLQLGLKKNQISFPI